MNFEKQFKELPDLFFRGTSHSKNIELPETIEEFWEKFYSLNLRNFTFDKDDSRVCYPARIRSFTE